MKVAIVGSRQFNNLSKVQQYVNALPKDTIVISGGAPGVDTIAERTAKRLGMQVVIFPANWNKYGNSAGVIRNGLIVEACDQMVLFWDKKSKGTENTLDKIRKSGKPFEVITP